MKRAEKYGKWKERNEGKRENQQQKEADTEKREIYEKKREIQEKYVCVVYGGEKEE